MDFDETQSSQLSQQLSPRLQNLLDQIDESQYSNSQKSQYSQEQYLKSKYSNLTKNSEIHKDGKNNYFTFAPNFRWSNSYDKNEYNNKYGENKEIRSLGLHVHPLTSLFRDNMGLMYSNPPNYLELDDVNLSNQAKFINNNIYLVESQKKECKEHGALGYLVSLFGLVATCSCPDFLNHKTTLNYECKHIIAAKSYKLVNQTPKQSIFQETEMGKTNLVDTQLNDAIGLSEGSLQF